MTDTNKINRETIINAIPQSIITEHKLTVADLLKRYGTDALLGLDEQVVKDLLKANGPNEFTPRKEQRPVIRFLRTLFLGFSMLLWVGVILGVALFFVHYDEPNWEKLLIAIALLLVIFVSSIFTFYQEGKSAKVMKAFLEMLPSEAVVIREGKEQVIKSKEVVIGDLIVLKSGDCVPADIRIIESENMKAEISALTGESVLVDLDGDVSDAKNPLYATNLVFSTTSIVEGSGKGIVIRTGDETAMGQIASLTSNITCRKSILARDVNVFIRIVTIWAFCLGTFFFIIMIVLGNPWDVAAMNFITVVIGSVPEGLVTTLTLSLTKGAKRMTVRNCLVKKLEAVEAMGATSIICSDKTGTLTQNRMTVTHTWYEFRVVSPTLTGMLSSERKRRSFQKLMRCAILCSRAEFKASSRPIPNWKRHVIGDASEAAILRFVEMSSRMGVQKTRTEHPKVHEIPFNSNNKFQLSVHKEKDSHFIVMKGAPERILERCSAILYKDKEIALSSHVMESVLEACTTFASNGKRILGFCDMENVSFTGKKYKPPEHNYRFLGLMALMDPPRPNVPDAVMTCRRAGIKVIMITGDHPLTAKSIANQVNIISDSSGVQHGIPDFEDEEQVKRNAIVLEGSHLKVLRPDELDEIILGYDEIVFARTNPQQKLQIVESCQRIGGIVAVTGDGVNDSPALKKADIGIAMGISGSAVTKQAAEIVLLDDNFASVVHGIEEGRLVFDNLKKSISYTLSHTFAEITPFLVHLFLGVPSPLGILPILVIDLVTDMWTAVAHAYQPAEGDLMLRKPRDIRTERLVSFPLLFTTAQFSLIEASAGVFNYFTLMASMGWTPRLLFFLRDKWDNRNKVMNDSRGRVWSINDRQALVKMCHASVFSSIIVCQMANVLATKSLRSTFYQDQGTNVHLKNTIIGSLGLSILLINVRDVNYIVGFRDLRLLDWVASAPFAFFIIAFDVFRKELAQRYPLHWLSKELIY